MPSLKNLIPALFLAATASAATCPNDWLSNTYKVQRCCYGNMMLEDTTAYCCVYDMTPPETTSVSTTATTTSDDYAGWSTAGECFSKIPFTATDYSDRVSSASSSLSVAHTASVASNEATSTSTSASTSSGSASVSTSNVSSSSTDAGIPVATAHGMMVGGAAVVAGLFML